MKIDIMKLDAQGVSCNVTRNEKTGGLESIEFYAVNPNPRACDALRDALAPYALSEPVAELALGEMIATLTKVAVLGAMS